MVYSHDVFMLDNQQSRLGDFIDIVLRLGKSNANAYFCMSPIFFFDVSAVSEKCLI